jgi:hypothetical protein
MKKARRDLMRVGGVLRACLVSTVASCGPIENLGVACYESTDRDGDGCADWSNPEFSVSTSGFCPAGSYQGDELPPNEDCDDDDPTICIPPEDCSGSVDKDCDHLFPDEDPDCVPTAAGPIPISVGKVLRNRDGR